MGLFKILGSVALGVGAIVAAPVVLPAAAAAGVASATAGAIGAAGAVAATVGTGVASAAGAAGLSSVAAIAGTSAGAASLGVVSTTGAVALGSTISGTKKMSEAKSIKEDSEERYHEKRREFERKQSKTNSSLEELGREKLKIWENYDRFVQMYQKIQNPPKKLDTNIETEKMTISPDEIDHIKAMILTVKDITLGGLASIGSGQLISLATSSGLISSISAASTGTAISSLSGAAATNATLAALGGGSLAAGGAGMAGGAAILGGLALTPALMVGGMLLNSKGKKNLEDAHKIRREVNELVEKMDDAISELNKLEKLSQSIQHELQSLYHTYITYIERMEQTVKRKVDYLSFTFEEQKNLEKTIVTLKLIKLLSTQNIIENNKILDEEINSTLRQVQQEHPAI